MTQPGDAGGHDRKREYHKGMNLVLVCPVSELLPNHLRRPQRQRTKRRLTIRTLTRHHRLTMT